MRPTMSYEHLLLLVVLALIVAVAVALIAASLSLLKLPVRGNSNRGSRSLVDQASSSGTYCARTSSHATTYTSPTLSSVSSSRRLRDMNSLIDRIRSRSPSKSECNGVIYFGKNCRDCPTCNTLWRWEAMHSKPSSDTTASLRQEEASFRSTYLVIACRC